MEASFSERWELVMDLTERLVEAINATDGLPLECKIGFLTKKEILCLYSLPGGRTINEDWAGNKEREGIFEVGFCTKDQKLADQILWEIANQIDIIQDNHMLISADDSFQVETIELTGTPFVSEQDIQGYSTYLLNIKITYLQRSERQ